MKTTSLFILFCFFAFASPNILAQPYCPDSQEVYSANENDGGTACGDFQNGSVSFTPASASLLPATTEALSNLADQMRAHPDCKVVIVGNAGGSKITQQLSWDRVFNVIEYMGEKNNIARDRFIFNYEGNAPEDQVVFRGANDNEDGPSTVAAPHPELRSR